MCDKQVRAQIGPDQRGDTPAVGSNPPYRAEIISGKANIVDGDTLIIGTTRIRLEGIDAPESDQICLNGAVHRWTCGIEARNRLVGHIGARSVECSPRGLDAYGRTLAVCRADGEDLNKWMVSQGWALAYVKYSNVYVPDQEDARSERRGLWSGAFVAPWDWRHRDKKTVVLGAYSVPVTAQALLLAPDSAAQSPSSDCVIKGNINRRGERIYFRPGQLDYELSLNLGDERVRRQRLDLAI